MAEIVEELISDAYFKAFSIKDRIRSVFFQTYPSELPSGLLTLYENICSEYQSRLVTLLSEYKDSPEDVVREIKLISAYLCELASHIRFAEGASVDRTPTGFVRSLEKFVTQVLPDSNLILRPQWRYNFKIFDLIAAYEKPISKSLSPQKFEELKKNIGDNLYVISFPGFERNNILVLTILGHEIGHPVANGFLEGENEKYISEIEEKIEEILPPQDPPIDRYVKKARLTKQAVEMRKRGLEEIISDLVSIYLFSVGALLSAVSFCHGVVQNIDEFHIDPHGQYYPPWRMRMRFMYNELRRQGIDGITNDYQAESAFDKDINLCLINKLRHIESAVSKTSDQDNIKQNKLAKIAYNSIEEAIPQVRDYLDRSPMPKYNLGVRYKELMNYCERLDVRIPANESEIDVTSPRIADLQSILIAGWLYRTARLSTMFTFDEPEYYVKNLETVNKLLLKGIELSEIQRTYRHYRLRKILFRKF